MSILTHDFGDQVGYAAMPREATCYFSRPASLRLKRRCKFDRICRRGSSKMRPITGGNRDLRCNGRLAGHRNIFMEIYVLYVLRVSLASWFKAIVRRGTPSWSCSPTCQVRVVRFYVRCASSFLPSSFFLLASSFFLLLLPPSSSPDLICQLLIAVVLAGSHLPALDSNGPPRTSSASSW